MQGASIAGEVMALIASATDRCDGPSDKEGKFNCYLPAGRYIVTASGVNILPYRRAILTIRAGEHKYITIRPVFVEPSDQARIANPIVHCDKQQLANGEEVLIRYQSSSKQDDGTRYRGKHLMLTADALSVYADEIFCSYRLEKCTAQGAVILESGGNQYEGTLLDLDLIHRRFKLTRPPTVEGGFN
jgi:hypothetical protein